MAQSLRRGVEACPAAAAIMAEMSLQDSQVVFAGSRRSKPPLKSLPEEQSAGFAVAAACCAKPMEPVNTTAANAVPIPIAFSFIIGCSPLIAAWKDVIISPCCIRLSPRNPDCCAAVTRGRSPGPFP